MGSTEFSECPDRDSLGDWYLWPAVAAGRRKEAPCERRTSQGENVFGIVTAKTDKDITIKAEGENEAKRYLLAPQGGAAKADLQAALKMVFPTNLVVFQAQGDQDPVLTGIQGAPFQDQSWHGCGNGCCRRRGPEMAYL